MRNKARRCSDASITAKGHSTDDDKGKLGQAFGGGNKTPAWQCVLQAKKLSKRKIVYGFAEPIDQIDL